MLAAMGSIVPIERGDLEIGIHVTDLSRVCLYVQSGGDLAMAALEPEEARHLAAWLLHQADVTDWCEERRESEPGPEPGPLEITADLRWRQNR